METLTKQQKQAVEKAELMQQQDMKATGKRIKMEQVRVTSVRPQEKKTPVILLANTSVRPQEKKHQ